MWGANPHYRPPLFSFYLFFMNKKDVHMRDETWTKLPVFARLVKDFNSKKDTAIHTDRGTYRLSTPEDGGLPIVIEGTTFYVKHKMRKKKLNGKLEQTCNACPSQWEGQLSNGEYIYIRYRFGRLAYGIGKTPDDAVYNEVFSKMIGDKYDGFMETAEMLKAINMTINE